VVCLFVILSKNNHGVDAAVRNARRLRQQSRSGQNEQLPSASGQGSLAAKTTVTAQRDLMKEDKDESRQGPGEIMPVEVDDIMSYSMSMSMPAAGSSTIGRRRTLLKDDKDESRQGPGDEIMPIEEDDMMSYSMSMSMPMAGSSTVARRRKLLKDDKDESRQGPGDEIMPVEEDDMMSYSMSMSM
jgi:hypothetical protein